MECAAQLFQHSSWLFSSCREHLVEFIEQLGQLFAEKLMRFAQAAALIERGEFQVLGLDADGGGDVIADQMQPGELFGREDRAGLSLCP